MIRRFSDIINEVQENVLKFKTKAEQQRYKNELNKEIRKDWHYNYEQSFVKDKLLPILWSYDRDKEEKEYLQFYDIVNHDMEIAYFAKTRKLIEIFKHKYPKIMKTYLDFLNKYQPKIDAIKNSIILPKQTPAQIKKEKLQKELTSLNYNKKVDEIIKEISKTAFDELEKSAKKNNKSLNFKVEDVIDNINENLKIQIATKLKDVNISNIKLDAVSVHNGQVNGRWYITKTDGTKKVLEIDTILAGGYNIQKLHIRTKIKF